MIKEYNYAIVNENQICIGVTTLGNKVELQNYIQIPDYNPTLLYRKWLDNQSWSEEKFEPSLNEKILEELEKKDNEIAELKEQLNILSDALEEYVATSESEVE